MVHIWWLTQLMIIQAMTRKSWWSKTVHILFFIYNRQELCIYDSYFFRSNTFVEFGMLECPVCLQLCVHPSKLPCGHIFCFLCVKVIFSALALKYLCHTNVRQIYETCNLMQINKIDLNFGFRTPWSNLSIFWNRHDH